MRAPACAIRGSGTVSAGRLAGPGRSATAKKDGAWATHYQRPACRRRTARCPSCWTGPRCAGEPARPRPSHPAQSTGVRAVRGRCHANTKRLTAAVPGRQSHRAYARRVCCSWPRRGPSFQARCSVWAARPEKWSARASWQKFTSQRSDWAVLFGISAITGRRRVKGRGVMATCSMEAQDVQARGAGPQPHRLSAHRPSSGKRAQWGVHIEEPQSTRPAEVSPSSTRAAPASAAAVRTVGRQLCAR